MKLKLPRYIKAYVDQNGKARYYFRRAGFKSVALPGIPFSPEFMVAYEIAAAGQPPAIGAARVLPGSMHALAMSYYNNSPEFLAMSPYSQRLRRNVIERFCRESNRPFKYFALGLAKQSNTAALFERATALGATALHDFDLGSRLILVGEWAY